VRPRARATVRGPPERTCAASRMAPAEGSGTPSTGSAGGARRRRKARTAVARVPSARAASASTRASAALRRARGPCLRADARCEDPAGARGVAGGRCLREVLQLAAAESGLPRRRVGSAPPRRHVAAQRGAAGRGHVHVPPGVERGASRLPRQEHRAKGVQRRARPVQQRHTARGRRLRLRAAATRVRRPSRLLAPGKLEPMLQE